VLVLSLLLLFVVTIVLPPLLLLEPLLPRPLVVKPRLQHQLEYLVADAKAKGCETLVSVGGVQSNHTRAVTAVAVASGLKCEWGVILDPCTLQSTASSPCPSIGGSSG
jgi:hypothetical protein